MSKAKFLTDLDVRLVRQAENGGRGLWRLLAPLTFFSTVAGRVFEVPAGMETDFSSVPRLPLLFWLAGDRAHAAAALHDHLYTTGEVPRELADQVFLEAMAVSGVPAWIRHPMYWAVRAAGGSHYEARRAA